MFRTSNPMLRESSFERTEPVVMGEEMTIDGTVTKAAFLLVLTAGVAAWPWTLFFESASADFPNGNPGVVTPHLWIGLIGGLIMAIATCFKPNWSAYTAPLYAGLEGLFLGAISGYFEASYPDIAIQAVGLTLGVAFAMFLGYRSGLLKATPAFRRGVMAATGGIALVYLATLVLGMFGVSIPLIHGSGLMGIGFSLFVVGIAALNLVLDFDLIEKGAEAGAPKYMEWYGAFSLLVTLIWLYIELLRLLSKLRSR